MAVRQVDYGGAELDLLCLADQAGEKHHAVGNVLNLIGQMFADEGLAVA